MCTYLFIYLCVYIYTYKYTRHAQNKRTAQQTHEYDTTTKLTGTLKTILGIMQKYFGASLELKMHGGNK